MTDRRFPPPWSVEDIGAAFVVKDGSGHRSDAQARSVAVTVRLIIRAVAVASVDTP
jgi:hypothetical protein